MMIQLHLATMRWKMGHLVLFTRRHAHQNQLLSDITTHAKYPKPPPIVEVVFKHVMVGMPSYGRAPQWLQHIGSPPTNLHQPMASSTTMITEAHPGDIMFVNGNIRRLLDEDSTASSYKDMKNGPCGHAHLGHMLPKINPKVILLHMEIMQSHP